MRTTIFAVTDTPTPDNTKPDTADSAAEALPPAEPPRFGKPDAPAEDELPTLHDCSVVKWLLILNIVIYVLDDLLLTHARVGGRFGSIGLFTAMGNFNIGEGINGLQVWRLFTYQFLHGGPVHLGLNMMALYVFGPMMEQWWGRRRFLAFYLLCGACGAWLMAMFAYTPLVDGNRAWLVGASGSIFGILVGVAMVFPKVEVKMLIPPMWVTVRTLAIVFLLLSVLQILISFNAGGNAAHLGGALFGYILIRRPWSLDFADKDAPRLDPPGEQANDEPADHHRPPDNNPPTT